MSESKSLLELAEDEMRERLEDEKQRKSIPHYTLAQIVKTLDKAEDHTPEVEDEERDVIEVITSLGLPVEKKIELLTEELKRVQDRGFRLLDAIGALKNDAVQLP